MYTRTIFYKVYSVATIVLSIIGIISTFLFFVPVIGEMGKVIPFLSPLTTVIQAGVVILSIFSLLFSYMEFSSMYAFADMIEYEKRNSLQPMIKRVFIFSGGTYRKFGFVITVIATVINVISVLVTVIATSIEKGCFICVPVIPLLITAITILFFFVHYYARYKAIGDLLDIVTTGNITTQMKSRLKEDKPLLLRAYCWVMLVVGILAFIAYVVIAFIAFQPLITLFGIGTAIFAIAIEMIFGIIQVMCIFLFGCFVDNIAKMVEHYQIKHNLLE